MSMSFIEFACVALFFGCFGSLVGGMVILFPYHLKVHLLKEKLRKYSEHKLGNVSREDQRA